MFSINKIIWLIIILAVIWYAFKFIEKKNKSKKKNLKKKMMKKRIQMRLNAQFVGYGVPTRFVTIKNVLQIHNINFLKEYQNSSNHKF